LSILDSAFSNVAALRVVGPTTITEVGAGPSFTFAGSFSNHPYQLYTNSIERARIRADGTFEIKGAGTAGTSPGFNVNPSTPANSFVIDSSGRLGIGTSSPGQKLDVNGEIVCSPNTAGKNTFQFATNAADDASLIMKSNTTTKVNIQANGTSYFNGGNVGIGTSSPIAQLNNTGTTALGTVNWPTTDVGVAAGRVLIGNEGILVLRRETVGANSGAELYLGATSGAGSTTIGNVSLKGGTENASNRASFFSISTQNTVGTGAEAMRITSGGLVGIGSTAPDVLLTAKLASGPIARFRTADTNFFGIDIGTDGASQTFIESAKGGSGSYQPLAFWTGGSQRATIDTSGRLLVGTSTSRSTYNAGDAPKFQVESVTAGATVGITFNSDNANSSELYLAKARGSAVDSHTIVQNNDNLGILFFGGADGTNIIRAASVGAQVDGTATINAGSFVASRRYKIATVGTTDFTAIGASANTVGVIFTATGVGAGTGTATSEPYANSMPGRLVFSTTADGASSPTEQMRIDNAGNLKFNSGYGSAATAYGCRAWVNFNGTGTPAIRASGNVSSITDISAGYYVVNFTTAMPDANYAAIATTDTYGIHILGTVSTSGCQVQIGYVNNTSGGVTLGDVGTICCSFFR
jgi:hypothetical protein